MTKAAPKTPAKKPASAGPEVRSTPVSEGASTHTKEPGDRAESPPPPSGEGRGEGATPASSAPIITHLLITSRREGFRRAGRPWSATPTLVRTDEFDEPQGAALLAEPMLEVLPMTAEAAEAWAKRD